MAADTADTAQPAARRGGMILIVTSLLSLVVLAHHPQLRGHHAVGDFAHLLQPLVRIDRIVHGSLIALLGLQLAAFHIFAARLGFGKPVIAAAFIAFAGGCVVMTIPAMLDGFVLPDVASACLARAEGCTAADAASFRLIAAMIQDFTKLALVLLAVATAGWSVALLTRRGTIVRGAGAVGLVCAAVPIAVVADPRTYLAADNLVLIFAAQALWTLLAGALMSLSPPGLSPAAGRDVATGGGARRRDGRRRRVIAAANGRAGHRSA